MKTKPTFLLWGFDDDGNPYVDGIGMDDTLEKYVNYATMRERFHPGLRRAVFHVEECVTAKQIVDFVASGKHPELRGQVISKLRTAGVGERDLPQKMNQPANPESFLSELSSL
jgi:hypothetical protein